MVKRGIRDFASDPRSKKDRQSILKFLNRFGASKKDLLLDVTDLEPTETSREQQDYQAYIRELYNTLATRCLCTRDGGRKEISANLRLNGCCYPGEPADSVNFRLFFLDHPHHHGLGDTGQWQDTQICVSRKTHVKMVGDHVEDHIDPSRTLVSVDKFCKIITNRNRTQLACNFSIKKLKKIQSSIPSLCFLKFQIHLLTLLIRD
jgi:hypothetical protein